MSESKLTKIDTANTDRLITRFHPEITIDERVYAKQWQRQVARLNRLEELQREMKELREDITIAEEEMATHIHTKMASKGYSTKPVREILEVIHGEGWDK
jgi:uncharacterized protein (UPF0335 family)